MKSIAGTKVLTFEDEMLPMEPIEFEVAFDYYYDPGKYNGLPENCYPEEEDGEASLPANFQEIVMNHYIAMARKAIKNIEAYVEEIKVDEIREWATDINQYDGGDY